MMGRSKDTGRKNRTQRQGRVGNFRTPYPTGLPRLKNVPQIISRIHFHKDISRNELDQIITKELNEVWSGLLTKPERQISPELARNQRNAIPVRALSKFDALILNQAETLGWRLFTSTRVLERLSLWEQWPNGAELFMYLGRALAKASQIVQKRVLPPIDDPDLVSVQIHTTEELRGVLREMKAVLSVKRNTSDTDILESFIRIVSESSPQFPLLAANVVRWQAFLEKNPASIRSRMSAKRSAPASLFIDWLAFCKGHEPETIRKKISSLGSLKRNM
jgi:hypothetical protein